MKLQLEVNSDCHDPAVFGGAIAVTPPIGESYWMFRVKLDNQGQAILGFPKFFTIGIGFAKEEDWNTNLPYSSSAEDIYAHIKHNKGNASIGRDKCIAAIELVRQAAGGSSKAQRTSAHRGCPR